MKECHTRFNSPLTQMYSPSCGSVPFALTLCLLARLARQADVFHGHYDLLLLLYSKPGNWARKLSPSHPELVRTHQAIASKPAPKHDVPPAVSRVGTSSARTGTGVLHFELKEKELQQSKQAETGPETGPETGSETGPETAAKRAKIDTSPVDNGAVRHATAPGTLQKLREQAECWQLISSLPGGEIELEAARAVKQYLAKTFVEQFATFMEDEDGSNVHGSV